MTNSEISLHRGEGRVGFKMVVDLLVNLAFEDFRMCHENIYLNVLTEQFYTPSVC